MRFLPGLGSLHELEAGILVAAHTANISPSPPGRIVITRLEAVKNFSLSLTSPETSYRATSFSGLEFVETEFGSKGRDVRSAAAHFAPPRDSAGAQKNLQRYGGAAAFIEVRRTRFALSTCILRPRGIRGCPRSSGVYQARFGSRFNHRTDGWPNKREHRQPINHRVSTPASEVTASSLPLPLPPAAAPAVGLALPEMHEDDLTRMYIVQSEKHCFRFGVSAFVCSFGLRFV